MEKLNSLVLNSNLEKEEKSDLIPIIHIPSASYFCIRIAWEKFKEGFLCSKYSASPTVVARNLEVAFSIACLFFISNFFPLGHWQDFYYFDQNCLKYILNEASQSHPLLL